MPFNALEEIIDGGSGVMPPSALGHHASIDAPAGIPRGQLDPAAYRAPARGVGLGIRHSGRRGLPYRIPDPMVVSREAPDRGKTQRDPRDAYVWADYAERGARELWPIDADRRTVECLFSGGGALRPVDTGLLQRAFESGL